MGHSLFFSRSLLCSRFKEPRASRPKVARARIIRLEPSIHSTARTWHEGELLLPTAAAAGLLCPTLHLALNFLGALATLQACDPLTPPPKVVAGVHPGPQLQIPFMKLLKPARCILYDLQCPFSTSPRNLQPATRATEVADTKHPSMPRDIFRQQATVFYQLLHLLGEGLTLCSTAELPVFPFNLGMSGASLDMHPTCLTLHAPSICSQLPVVLTDLHQQHVV